MGKSIKINFILNLLLTVSNVLFPIVTFPYLSRIIGPIGIGEVQLANANISYFLSFAIFGINTYGI